MSQRATVRVLRTNDASSAKRKTPKPTKATSAKSIFDFLVKGGTSEQQAWEMAGRVFGRDGYAPPIDVVTMSKDDYITTPHNNTMAATKTAPPPKKLRRGDEDQVQVIGEDLEHIAARAVASWRESKGMTIPEISQKLGIDMGAWYRIESGSKPATMAKYIKKIARAANEHVLVFLARGKSS